MLNYTKKEIDQILSDYKTFDKIALDCFSKFDEDKSGNIEMNELENLLQETTKFINWVPPPFDTIQEYYDKFDINGGDRLNFYEFKPLFKGVLTKVNEKNKKNLRAQKPVKRTGDDYDDYDMTAFRYFMKHDFDRSGNLNRQELVAAFKDAETDYGLDPVGRTELDNILNSFDFSTDQALNFFEFKKVFYKYMLKIQ